jgi:hypothetical protein
MTPWGFSDASFNDSDSGRSTIGFVALLGSHPVSWKSKVSSPVPQSVFEAEWLALNTLSRELVWLRTVLSSVIGHVSVPSTIHMDNSACINRLDDRVSEGNKHFRPKYFYVINMVKDSVISVEKVTSDSNVVDIFTKALGNPAFGSHTQFLTIE